MRHGRLGRPERMRDGIEIGFGRTWIFGWRAVILLSSLIDIISILVGEIIEMYKRRLDFEFAGSPWSRYVTHKYRGAYIEVR